MSAFLVSNATMNRVVAAINDEAKRTEFGKALFAMNHRALNARYNDPIITEAEIDLTSSPRNYSAIEKYKAIMCLKYQCSEGDVPDEPLFKELEELGNQVAHDIAHDHPEYSKVPWDFETI